MVGVLDLPLCTTRPLLNNSARSPEVAGLLIKIVSLIERSERPGLSSIPVKVFCSSLPSGLCGTLSSILKLPGVILFLKLARFLLLCVEQWSRSGIEDVEAEDHLIDVEDSEAEAAEVVASDRPEESNDPYEELLRCLCPPVRVDSGSLRYSGILLSNAGKYVEVL